MPLTAEVLERCGAPAATAQKYLPLVSAAMREFGIVSPVRARMFLAQLAHESAGLTAFEERASGADYEGNKALGNTQPGDGVRFKGRGPIQLTGRWNYGHYGKLLGLDLLRRPQLAAEPSHGFRLAAAYFEDRGCSRAADRGDFREVTRRINAALLHYDRRLALYKKLSRLDCTPGPAFLSQGDDGDAVGTLTRRLSFVRAKDTGKPYLDGKRTRFDGETARALRAFQEDRGLRADGRYGPRSAKALARATAREKKRRAEGRERVREPATAVAGGRKRERSPADPARLPALAKELRRLDAETDRAWRRIVAHGRRRRAVLATLRSRAGGAAGGGGSGRRDDADDAALRAILLRIEAKLGALVEIEQKEAAGVVAGPPPAVASGGDVATVLAPPGGGASAIAQPNGASEAPPAPAPRRARSEEELLERIERLDRALASTRAVLIARYATVDKEIARLAPPEPRRRRKGEPRRKRGGTGAGGNGTGPASPGAPAPRRDTVGADEIRAVQLELNRFTERHLEGLGPLVVDGVRGPATRKRIRRVKYFLGYSGPEQRKLTITPEFRRRVRHPRSARYLTPAMASRGLRRRRAQRKAAKKSAAPRAGVATFDGRPVAAWLEPYLVWARANGWRGTINSGYRDPAYSEGLCREICGAPSCPGRCAGRSSNHSGRVRPAGAIDVSEYAQFGELMRRCPLKPRIFNALGARDPVHFSASGR